MNQVDRNAGLPLHHQLFEVLHEEILLGIKKKSPLLFFERVSFSPNNIPVELLQAYYRADRYTLYSELQGGTG